MFNFISWEQYFTFVGVLLVIYYAAACFKYFKWELLAAVGIQKEDNNGSDYIALPEHLQQQATGDSDDVDISPVVQSFTDEIAACAEEAVAKNSTAIEILELLVRIAAKYPVMNTEENGPLRDEIILQEIGNRFPALLQHEDLKKLLL